jgi:hypothetical protein
MLTGTEINLNGGIVSNKGFIRQMANPGTKIIEGKYVSAWNGIQSAGQTVGQIVSFTSRIEKGVQVVQLTASPASSVCNGKVWSQGGTVHTLVHLGTGKYPRLQSDALLMSLLSRASSPSLLLLSGSTGLLPSSCPVWVWACCSRPCPCIFPRFHQRS